MCGIAGIIDLNQKSVNQEQLTEMIHVIHHRGPDDEGYFIDENVGFGHCRLSIIDLSDAGHQPMSNEDQTLWIVYNGEVYNFVELREELEKIGYRFKSNTDTEVILYSYQEWGEKCLEKFNGMWAFAIYDKKKKKLFCARDRFGIKPFYYFYNQHKFIFASEIKGILVDKTVPRKPNNQIIYDYLANNYLDHTEETFFSGIKQLPAAHYIIMESKVLSINRYWDLNKSLDSSQLSEKEYAEGFKEIFIDSVRLRLRADVPAGTCLSGGLDSSSIVCVANDLLHKHLGSSLGDRQQSFSAVYEEKSFDESRFIEEVVKKTGIKSHYTFPKAEELIKELDELIWHQEEPFGSTSIYAQWCVFKLAKEKGIKVMLDGQGSDEYLLGYHSSFSPFYCDLIRNHQIISLLKEIIAYGRIHGFSKLSFISPNHLPFIPDRIKPLLKKYVFRGRYSLLKEDFGKKYKKDFFSEKRFESNLKNYSYTLLFFTSLPGLLRYEDKNSMAFSIESRVPFLDYRLVEYLSSLPDNAKIHNAVTKVTLRRAMKGILPEKIENRMDKIGFATPEDIWFRTVLKDWIWEIIQSRSFKERGYFDTEAIEKEFRDFCKGGKNINSTTIWHYINLELWFRKFFDNVST